jgi:GNAT superfamily N-acetyltransferase
MSNYAIRPIRPGDAAAVARHRVRMFADMGELTVEEAAPLATASEAQLEPLIASGEYRGWLAEADGAVVAGVGFFLHRLLPRREDLGLRQEAYVVNVYTDPAHRRRGLSRRLMEELIGWSRAQGLTRLTLHASVHGRPMYESLGFAPTNEMRLLLR